MTLDEYRQEHVKFHQRRVVLFMLAAETLRNFIQYFSIESDESFRELVRAIVIEARAENQIVRWWKHMPEEQLQRQISFWS